MSNPQEDKRAIQALVSWDVAKRVASRVNSSGNELSPMKLRVLQEDFTELTAQAEELVAKETGLVSLSGNARARVTDRNGWVSANVSSFQRLMGPLAEKVAQQSPSSRFLGVSRAASGLQVGAILGWMSTRVLGQYDLLLVEDENPEDQDIVYYVGPNVVSLEERFALPPRQFRLWLALHEVTHRAQFTGVPWTRNYFQSLVEAGITGITPDPTQFMDIIKRLLSDLKEGKNPFAASGILGVIASEEQRSVFDKIQAFMSLLEGHGDVTMDRAGKLNIPDAERFSRILRQRRKNAGGITKLMMQIIGMEAKLNQYAAGERFIYEVESVAGKETMSKVWESSDNVPTLAEIAEPKLWLERVGNLAAV